MKLKIINHKEILRIGSHGLITEIKLKKDYTFSVFISKSISNCKLVHFDSIRHLFECLKREDDEENNEEEIENILYKIMELGSNYQSKILTFSLNSEDSRLFPFIKKYFNIISEMKIPIGYSGADQYIYYATIPCSSKKTQTLARIKRDGVELKTEYERANT